MEYLSFHLPQEFVDQYKDRKPNWGFDIGGGNTLAELTFITKYSRRKEDGTKERWYETVRRCIEGMYSILKDHCKANRTPWNEPKALRSAMDAYERMFTFKWTPPGRGIWMMGTEFVHKEHNSAPLQNCAFLSTEKISSRSVNEAILPFVRLMEMSMHGIGVGFDSKGAGKLTIHSPNPDETRVYVVEDSREGWVESQGVLLESYFFENRPTVEFDYSQIRPAGEPLKRFGGVAAGPGPLMDLHDAMRKLFDGRAGERITELDIGDIMNLEGKCLSGDTWVLTSVGPRRVVDLVGIPIQLVVDGQLHMSSGFFQTGIKEVLKIRTQQGWCVRVTKDHLIRRGNGFDWVRADELQPGDDIQLHEHVDNAWQGVGTEIEGYVLGHLVGDGSIRSTKWGDLAMLFTWDQDTGNEIVRKVLADAVGSLPHRSDWKAWRPNGGEGRQICSSKALTALAESYGVVRGHKKVTDEIEKTSSDFTRGFLRGLFDADGSVCAETRSVTLSQSDHEMLLRVQRMLGRLGILSSVRDTGRRDQCVLYVGGIDAKRFMDRVGFLNTRKTDLYYENEWVRGPYSRQPRAVVADVVSDGVEPVYDVTVEDVHAFDANGIYVHNCVVAGSNRRSAEIWLSDSDSKEFLNAKNHEVNPERMGKNGWGHLSNNSVFASVGQNYDHLIEHIAANGEPGLFYLDLARAYGRLADPPNNRDHRVAGVNPCAEQSLEHLEQCTLVETFPYHHEDFEDFKQTLKAAYLYAKAVTLMPTQWPESNEVMQRNRRIGCSVSGVAQFVEGRGINVLRKWLDDGYEFICQRDSTYSEWLGVRESIKKTSVKPSGTVSLIAGATPGGHWPTGPELVDGAENDYIRRQRFSHADPLVTYFKKAGYHVEPDFMDPNYSVVVEFPTRGPLVRTERQVSVWEKAMLAATLQRHWADNQVSATLTFREDEKDQVGPLIHNFDGQLKSISLLPLLEGGAFKQMPYEGLQPGEWEKMTKKVKSINWNAIYDGDALDAEGEKFCANDVCEIP